MPESDRPERPTRDWSDWVRGRLRGTQADGWERSTFDQVAEELAEMMEECEREALLGGATEDQASECAEAQIPDWKALVRRVEAAARTPTPGAGRLGRRLLTGRRFTALSGIGRDLRSALRGTVHSPGFAAVVIITLALGIGANAAIFSAAFATLLAPLPYPDSDHLLWLFSTHREEGIERAGVSTGDVVDWRRRNTVLEGIGAWYVMGRTLAAVGSDGSQRAEIAGSQRAEIVNVAQVSEDFFSVMGTAPVIGRTFTTEETALATFNSAASHTGSDPVAILSHRAWMQRFGGDPEILRRTFVLDRQTWRVAGVMPPEFTFPGDTSPESTVELWIPWSLEGERPHDQRYLSAVARLRAGTTREQAQGELDRIAAELGDELPDSNRGWGVALVPLREELVGDSRITLLVLLAAVVVVLLVSCLNIACLQLVRIGERQREMALRLALGASRLQIVRQLLAESLLLALLGGAAAVLVAQAVLKGLAAVDLGVLPSSGVGLGLEVWVAAGLAGLAAGLFFGLLPLAAGPRQELAVAVGEGSGRSAGGAPRWERMRRALVVCELAMAVVLLAAAGLLVRSFSQLLAVDVGFRPEHVAVLPITLDNHEYDSGAKVRAYYQRLLERLSGLPGVISAGGVTALPMSPIGPDFDRPIWAEGDPPPPGGSRRADIRMATPGYFETMGISVRRGRAFDELDGPTATRVVMVNESLAQDIWPGEDPLGNRLVIDYSTAGTYPYEVVGVVADIRFYGIRSRPEPELYLPHAQRSYLILNIVARTAVPPEALIADLRRAVLEVDPMQPAYSVEPLLELVGSSIDRDRYAAGLIGAFAAVALALALLGIFGVLSYQVTRRIREVGVRAALGASRRRLVGMMLGSGLRLTVMGLGLGVLLSLAATRALASLLFEVSPLDPMTFGVVLLASAVCALLACWLPARRAAEVDPVVALRHE